MKNHITVLGIEAEGIRGVRLEEEGTERTIVDSNYWPFDGKAEDGENASEGQAADAAAPNADQSVADDTADAPDRYAAMVEAMRDAAKRFGTREVVLSVPLSSLLVKVSRMSLEDRDHLAEKAGIELVKVSPFPDETPVTGVEMVAETDKELVTLLAAFPDAAAADIGDALDEAKVRVTRTDITAMGWLRTLWPRIFTDGASEGRKVVLMDLDNGWDVTILDDGALSLLRGIGNVADAGELAREVMLSMLRAGASGKAGEIVIFSRTDVDAAFAERLEQFAPVRIERLSEEYGGVEGVARRTLEGSSLDVTPQEWVELRTEARFTKKLIVFLAAAAAGWLLLMGVLFGVPFVYGHMTERQKRISKRHAVAYNEVKEMRDKVKLVQQYSDHARGSLEMLKAVSDRMPAGITLTSFNYRRGERLSIVGEAQQPTDVYEFKNALTDAATEDEEKLFAEVTLTGPSQSRGVHKFTIEGSFEAAEDGK